MFTCTVNQLQKIILQRKAGILTAKWVDELDSFQRRQMAINTQKYSPPLATKKIEINIKTIWRPSPILVRIAFIKKTTNAGKDSENITLWDMSKFSHFGNQCGMSLSI